MQSKLNKLKKIQEAISSQKTATFFDKAMQWRYLAMLGNPKPTSETLYQML